MDDPRPPGPPPETLSRSQVTFQRISRFLTWCAGTVPETLRLYPTEKAKYEGIGGAVLTTGVLAFFSGFYAIYTTLASGPYSVVISVVFAFLWGLAIFNLDRYIVSSLRKPTDTAVPWRRRAAAIWLPALPRMGLAILIGITLSKPLELRLFQGAIAGQAEINRDRAVTAKRASLTQSSRLDPLRTELHTLNAEVASADQHAQLLEQEFRKEADGTGGSLRYGYSEVARVKESAAVKARQQAEEARKRIQERAGPLEAEIDNVSASIDREVGAFKKGLADDFLTRMTALSDLTANSSSVWWISAFVTFLLIGIEITPVLVKLISPIGPYDVKLDALNSVGTTEAILKRDTTNSIATQHYALVEKAEHQADEEFFDIRNTLAGNELHRKVEQWKSAKAGGAAGTMDQLVNEVRREILTLRNL